MTPCQAQVETLSTRITVEFLRLAFPLTHTNMIILFLLKWHDKSCIKSANDNYTQKNSTRSSTTLRQVLQDNISVGFGCLFIIFHVKFYNQEEILIQGVFATFSPSILIKIQGEKKNIIQSSNKILGIIFTEMVIHLWILKINFGIFIPYCNIIITYFLPYEYFIPHPLYDPTQNKFTPGKPCVLT